MESPFIIPIVIIAVIVLILLIWRNAKDKTDINPELTDELEKQRKQNEEAR